MDGKLTISRMRDVSDYHQIGEATVMIIIIITTMLVLLLVLLSIVPLNSPKAGPADVDDSSNTTCTFELAESAAVDFRFLPVLED